MQNACELQGDSQQTGRITTRLKCSPCIENISISSSRVVGICPVAAMHQSTQRQLQQPAPRCAALRRYHCTGRQTRPRPAPTNADATASISSSEKTTHDDDDDDAIHPNERSLACLLGLSVYANGLIVLQSQTLLADGPQANECRVLLVDNICVHLNGTLDPPARFAHRPLRTGYKCCSD